MTNYKYTYTLLMFVCVATAGCNTTTVRTTKANNIASEQIQIIQIPEEQLLDVAIAIFDPGIVKESEDTEVRTFSKIREAEARYLPYRLMETLQGTGNWGIVRVIPAQQSDMDVWINARILESNGLDLELNVTVQDSSGKTWFSKKYTGEASKYSYDSRLSKRNEAFQELYNQIANDMLIHYYKFNPEEIITIRTITELKFARQFSAEVFDEYLNTDKNGIIFIDRLPPENDPILMRIREIRERDYLFIDTLQAYYASFVRTMDEPYLEWRRATFEEGAALRKVKSQSATRLIGGAVAVLAGILAQGSSSRVTRTAGQVGIGAGIGAIYSGMNKNEEAKVHAEALEEISASLNSEMEPHTLELEDRTVTLTGSVNEQYRQWRQILKEIYETETGRTSPVE